MQLIKSCAAADIQQHSTWAAHAHQQFFSVAVLQVDLWAGMVPLLFWCQLVVA